MAIAPSVQASAPAANGGGTGASAARGGGDGSLFAALLQLTGASGPETSDAARQLLGSKSEGDLASLLDQARALLESGGDVSLQALLDGQDGNIVTDGEIADGAEGGSDAEIAAALAAALNINMRAPEQSGDTDPGSAGGSADETPTSPTVIPAAADAAVAIPAAMPGVPAAAPATGPSAKTEDGAGISAQAGGLDAALARFAAKGDTSGATDKQKADGQVTPADRTTQRAATDGVPDAVTGKNGAEGDKGDKTQSGPQQHGDIKPAPQIVVRSAGTDGQSALLQLQQIDSNGQQGGSQTIAVPVAAVTATSSTSAATPYGSAAAAVPVNMIAVEITRQANAGNSRFQIRLDPPELGRIDVRLDLASDGRVHTHLQVDNPDTYDAIQRDPRGLERALQNAGLKLDDGSIQISLRDPGGFMQRNGQDNPNFQNFQQSAAAYGTDSWSEDEETIVEAWRIAPAGGGLDMRV